VTPSKPWPRVIKAPPWLAERMAELRRQAPPTPEEVETQMAASARISKMLDRGLTQDEIKQIMVDHSDDILGQLNAPWREKIGPNRYRGSCGCIFNAEGERLEWCGEQY
jgi:hypothetical protein